MKKLKKTKWNEYIFFFLLTMPHNTWNLSSPTRDGTRAPCSRSTDS